MSARPPMMGNVPPASVPIAFFGAAAVGLVGFGMAAWLAADKIVASPIYPGTLSAVHVAMLAFLTVGVLGALHQFAPVIGQRPLRSVAVARVSCVGIVVTAWLLPTGFAHGPEDLVPLGGVIGATTVVLIGWNLSGPLGRGATGLPVWGLRCSVTFLIATVTFGVVYAFNRQTAWFPLLPHRVLAHAHLGLLGWLGLTYVSVAEKLWPMFLLSHRPSDRSGHVGVWSLAAGVTVLTPGLLFGQPAVAWPGGVLVGVGVIAHITSLATYIRHRRRPLEVLHAFVLASAGFLLTAGVLAALAGALDVTTVARTRLVSAEVMALTAWLGLAIVGHVHKIVPFIGYQVLRADGVATGPGGRPLLFSDLTSKRPAVASLVCGTTGGAAMVIGILTTSSATVATGAVLLSVTGVITTLNLVAGPRRVRRHARRAVAPLPTNSTTTTTVGAST
jgi:hypothetical protein